MTGVEIKVKRIMKSNTDSVNNLAFGAVSIGAITTDFALWNGVNGRFVSLGGRKKGKDKDGKEKWWDNTYIEDVIVKDQVIAEISKAFDSMS